MLSAIFDNGLFDEYHTVTSLHVAHWVNEVLRSHGEEKKELDAFIKQEMLNARNLGKPLAFRILPEFFESTGQDPEMFYLSDVFPRDMREHCAFIAIDFGYKYRPLKMRGTLVESVWYAPRY